MSLAEIGEKGKIVFKETVEILRLKEVPYRVFSGTALGLYRDGDLIPTDTDLDFLIPGWLIGSGNIKDIFPDHVKQWVTDNQVVLNHPKEKIIMDFQFYRKHLNGYVIEAPHHFDFTLEQLDNPVELDTKYGKVTMPSDIENLFVKKYGDDWKTPKYQQKRLGI